MEIKEIKVEVPEKPWHYKLAIAAVVIVALATLMLTNHYLLGIPMPEKLTMVEALSTQILVILWCQGSL